VAVAIEELNNWY